MPRPKTVAELPHLDTEGMQPIRSGQRPELGSALNFIVTASNSAAMRELVMERSDFPLRGDMPAFLLLNQLVYRGAARPTDMADAIQTSRSSVSRIVTRLEAAGLIMRTPDPNDDRALVIGLTLSGRTVGQRIVDLGEQIFSSVLDEWSEDELIFLERLVVKLARSMERASRHLFSSVSGPSWPLEKVGEK
ncbi:MarR family winged helix-turn-helix transcriptional regulator [Arthrobacter sp. MMS18-M83]|uniref:MarR family winged helix-turn-helix transcriptional regulator n=1 Tax=Arthrobacter sp. MMS18-M83 TaxID=2996261 RepID=UPI00227CD247|nr:MarR family transcriptional regulator [Arthrobacter sp. MMS18-M83]WAH97330.1 MarR family transcriptional regulator [Arthrobacter sp. MMS18-M83]